LTTASPPLCAASPRGRHQPRSPRRSPPVWPAPASRPSGQPLRVASASPAPLCAASPRDQRQPRVALRSPSPWPVPASRNSAQPLRAASASLASLCAAPPRGQCQPRETLRSPSAWPAPAPRCSAQPLPWPAPASRPSAQPLHAASASLAPLCTAPPRGPRPPRGVQQGLTRRCERGSVAAAAGNDVSGWLSVLEECRGGEDTDGGGLDAG